MLQEFLQVNPLELKVEIICLMLAMLSPLSGANEFEIHCWMSPEKDKIFLI